jgi:ankyrin repeat protein
MPNRTIGHLALWPRLLIALVAVLITIVSASEGAASTGANAPWFQPTLTSKNDAICDAILTGARSHATDYDGLKAAPPFFSGDDDRGNSSIQGVPDHPELLALVRPGAAPLYVEHIRNPGCGGACESESLGLHTMVQSDEGQTGSSTPASDGWTIYETNSRRHFVVGVVDRQLEVYRAGSDGQWQLACRVQLEPDLTHSADPRVQKAIASLQSLRDAAEDIARGEGYGMCGTMHTDGRWAGDFQHALDQVLFDPDATAISHQIPSENSYGDYPRIYEALQDWSLGGIFEFRALQKYDAQLKGTTVVVKEFYQYAFHWSEPQSLEMAQASIPNAVSHRFGFYLYSPYSVPGERELRRALLTHQPISAIHAIDIDVHALDKASHDSILNVAIEYPEALSYLLAQGADPNLPNEFGKTPLMYAAQYDQPQALQILLRAGADPNATTIVAPDNCGYAIQKHNVTALHYAVKFASRKVVQALLDAGAMTYIRTEHYIDPSQGSYPLEWLHDGNANLSVEDTKVLERQLQVPSQSERKGFSVSLTAAAESANSAGRTVEAYQKIRLAGIADPTNGQAIADFPLLALKAGAVGPALEGSGRAITNAKTDADRAAGLFNQGLACLQNTSPMATYKNVVYCQNGPIGPFVQAWKMQRSPARTNKLLQLLGSNEPTNCVMTFPGDKTVAFRFHAVFDQRVPSGQLERIYAMHPTSLTIDSETIHWQQPNIAPPRLVTPHVVDTLNVNRDYNLTILEGDAFATSVSVNGGKCDLGNSASSPRPR